jgi:hypothetical protein
MAEKITFEWDSNVEAEGVDYYELFEKAPAAPEPVLVASNIGATFFDILMTDMAQGSYEYYLRSVNEFGTSAFTAPLTVNFILPSPPTNFRYSLV